MKLRCGFVSNSSSSSCIIFGRILGNPFTEHLTLDEDKTYVMLGECLCDGDDVIPITQDIVDYLYGRDESMWTNSCSSVIEVYQKMEDIYGDELPQLPEGTRIWLVEEDYHPTEDLDDFIQRYGQLRKPRRKRNEV